MSWTKIAAIAFLVISLLIVYLTFEVWAAAFLGVLCALSLNGPAEWLRSKWHMPAWVATALSILMVLSVLTGLGFLIVPPLVGQADELGRKLPHAMETTLNWLDERKWGRYVVGQVGSLSGMSAPQLDSKVEMDDGHKVMGQAFAVDAAQQQTTAGEDAVDAGQQMDSALERSDNGTGNDNDEADGSGNGNGDTAGDGRSIIILILHALPDMLRVTTWTIVLLAISFMVTLYVALNPDVYRRGIFWLIPVKHETVATLTLARMCVTLRWWMLGRLTCMLAIGLLTSLGMWLIGMPAPIALGALAGLFSFVPNIGPIIAGIPGVLLAVPEGPWMLFSVLAVYIGAQLIESNLIDPLVDQYTVTTPPAVLIVFQVIMAVLAGVWGVLIATPLLVVVFVLVQQLYVRECVKKPIKVVGSINGKISDKGTDNQQGKTVAPHPA